jgi:signal transduction histidine kinase
MNITRRRGTIATFITLGALLTGLTITLNITWIVLNERRLAWMVVGIVFFAILVAGVVLNTVFLIREVRRNERQLGQRQRQQNRTILELEPLVAECIAITLQRHHLPPEAIQLLPTPGAVRLHVQGIADDLRTAVLNLLENAVKYSPGGVHITASLAITRYTYVSLRITDTGVGLAANQLKRIFTRFYRVPGRNQNKIKGTGLGLFLVRTIAKQHGGQVSAASPGPGLGTTITLKLPLANPSGAPAATHYTGIDS